MGKLSSEEHARLLCEFTERVKEFGPDSDEVDFWFDLYGNEKELCNLMRVVQSLVRMFKSTP